MSNFNTINSESKDKYTGGRDPMTQQRHGTGTYEYQNKFFTYIGDWVNGVKHGNGVLKMKNGTTYTGTFVQGEIQGQGEMQWATSSKYVGGFHMGEKQGFGQFIGWNGETYQGQWKQNLYHGDGILVTSTGDLYEGTFFKNNLDGKSKIKQSDGGFFEGMMKMGQQNGFGILKSLAEKIFYQGGWEDDLKHDSQNFISLYSVISNRFQTYSVTASKEGEEEQTVVEVNSATPNSLIEYEISAQGISFEIHTAYQGPDILDPVQPTQEEIEELIKNWQQDNQKIKNPPPMPDFGKPRMISPKPEPVQCETNRLIKIELMQQLDPQKGKENEPPQIQSYRVDYRELIIKRKEEIKRALQKRAQQEALEKQIENDPQNTQQAGKDPKKQEAKKQIIEIDTKINIFNENQPENQKPMVIQNRNGVARIENLQFPENFPIGKFYFQISELEPDNEFKYGTIQTLKIQLTINPAGGADPQKNLKKK